MRLPFDFNNSSQNQEARIKLIYTSPQHHQNIEISMDGDEISVEALIDAFQRFLGALNVCLPENVVLGFVELDEEDEETKGTIDFTLDEDDDEEEEDK
jgi:hypothetical protein